jgi:ATP-dependent RNA helicase DeaD
MKLNFELSPVLEKAFRAMDFRALTPIQVQSIPPALEGRDLLARAETGSGKSIAFCLPMLQARVNAPEKASLVLAPTREIAIQLHDLVARLSKGTGLSPVALVGGQSMAAQRRSLKSKGGARIWIATPGRLLDHIRRGNLDPRQVDFLALDEADRMLDMGFEPQIREVVGSLSTNRQTLLFSATFPSKMLKLASFLTHEPLEISLDERLFPVDRVAQSVLNLRSDEKWDHLNREVRASDQTILVFAGSRRKSDQLTKRLSKAGHAATVVHGGRSQAQRNRAVEEFKSGRYRVLVGTDVVARGLDVPKIGLVINYELPRESADYVHRVGRTSRAGERGAALSFVSPEQKKLWKQILRELGIDEGSVSVRDRHPAGETRVQVEKPVRKASTAWVDPTKRRPRKDEESERRPRKEKRNLKERSFGRQKKKSVKLSNRLKQSFNR